MINLLTVAKAPIPGQVKTRLQPSLSAHDAAAVAAAALLDTLEAVCATPASRPVVALLGRPADGLAAADLGAALTRCRVIGQHGAGLGGRLARAHRDAGDGPVLQIGMDTPQVTPDLLTEAAQPLRTHHGPDAVLGLAEDGGWWALGLRDGRNAAVLTEVPMSQPDTGAETLCALIRAGLSVAMAPILRDVDTMADAAAVAALVPYGRFGRLTHRLLDPTRASVTSWARA